MKPEHQKAIEEAVAAVNRAFTVVHGNSRPTSQYYRAKRTRILAVINRAAISLHDLLPKRKTLQS